MKLDGVKYDVIQVEVTGNAMTALQLEIAFQYLLLLCKCWQATLAQVLHLLAEPQSKHKHANASSPAS